MILLSLQLNSWSILKMHNALVRAENIRVFTCRFPLFKLGRLLACSCMRHGEHVVCSSWIHQIYHKTAMLLGKNKMSLKRDQSYSVSNSKASKTSETKLWKEKKKNGRNLTWGIVSNVNFFFLLLSSLPQHIPQLITHHKPIIFYFFQKRGPMPRQFYK